MTHVHRLPLAGVLVSAAIVTAGTPVPADLKPETVEAFDRYIAATDARVRSELADPASYRWIDTLPPSRRDALEHQLSAGDVVLEQLETRDDGRDIEIPDGLVHHWIGIVRVPGATMPEAVALMQDYDRHDDVFAPRIANSRLVDRAGDTFAFTMRFVIEGRLSAVLETDQQARFVPLDPERTHSRIASTRIVEIANPGTIDEYEKPEGHDRGYLWRQVSYWRFAEGDGATDVQCEVVSLSRGLPWGFGWLLGGMARAIPRDTLEFTLATVRRTLAG